MRTWSDVIDSLEDRLDCFENLLMEAVPK